MKVQHLVEDQTDSEIKRMLLDVQRWVIEHGAWGGKKLIHDPELSYDEKKRTFRLEYTQAVDDGFPPKQQLLKRKDTINAVVSVSIKSGQNLHVGPSVTVAVHHLRYAPRIDDEEYCGFELSSIIDTINALLDRFFRHS